MVAIPDETGLCTIDQVIQKSKGRLISPLDEDLEEQIQNEITDLSTSILEKYPDVTADNRNASMACTYGVLARLVIDDMIPSRDDRNISSYKDSGITISYEKSNNDTPVDDCGWYTYYINKLNPSSLPFFIGTLSGEDLTEEEDDIDV